MSGTRTHDEQARILGALERQHGGPKAFRGLSSASVWRSATLAEKDKHLVAVAIAQVTRCAFCIEHHSIAARRTGASEPEAIAASYVSAALEAFGEARVSVADGRLAVEDEAAVRDTELARQRLRFAQAVFDTEVLAPGLVWVVAAAAAYAQANEARRRVFHEVALAAGQPAAALDEAYAIAVVLRAGAVYAHVLHVVDAFRD